MLFHRNRPRPPALTRARTSCPDSDKVSRSVLWRSPKMLQRGARQAGVRHRNGARASVPFPLTSYEFIRRVGQTLDREWIPGHGFLGWLGGISLAMAVIVTRIRTCNVCWTQQLQHGSEICNSEALRIPWVLVNMRSGTSLCCWLRISISGPCRNEPNATSCICVHALIRRFDD